MSDLVSKAKVGLKYCGSCNPLINLSQIGHEIREAIKREDGFMLVCLENDCVNSVIILCGCPRACGNKAEIRAKAFRSIVVAGETVDAVPVAEKDICLTIMEKLKSSVQAV